jgi:hypothetical protein
MKLKHIILTVAVLGGAYYLWTMSKKKKEKVIKDRGFEIIVEEDE